jgi:hypothetical protein
MGAGAPVAQKRRSWCRFGAKQGPMEPKTADLCAFFWGKSSVFPGVFGTLGRGRAANGVKPKGGRGKDEG